jgi:hypothetical protein
MKTIQIALVLAAALNVVSCQSGTAGYFNVRNAPPMTPSEQARSMAGIRAIEDEGFRDRHRERMSQAAAWRYARPACRTVIVY